MMKVYYILLLTLVGMALSTKGNEVDTDLEMEEQGISAREELVSAIFIPCMSRTPSIWTKTDRDG